VFFLIGGEHEKECRHNGEQGKSCIPAEGKQIDVRAAFHENVQTEEFI